MAAGIGAIITIVPDCTDNITQPAQYSNKLRSVNRQVAKCPKKNEWVEVKDCLTMLGCNRPHFLCSFCVLHAFDLCTEIRQ